jgi:hypothetical protein
MDSEFDVVNDEIIEIEMYYDDEDVEHHQHEANGESHDQIVPDIDNLK